MKMDISVPTLDDFSRNGFDALALFIGTILLLFGALTIGFTVTNRLLTTGICVICLGFASRCYSHRYADVSYYGEKTPIAKSQVVGFLIWSAVALLSAVVAFKGH